VVAILLLSGLLACAAMWGLRYFRRSGDVTLFALIVFAVLSNMTDGRTLIMSPGHQWLYFWFPVAILAAYELRCKNEGGHASISKFCTGGDSDE